VSRVIADVLPVAVFGLSLLSPSVLRAAPTGQSPTQQTALEGGAVSAACVTQPPALPRVTRRTLLGSDAPLADFDELRSSIERGLEIIATDADGRRVRGRVACALDDGLVLWRLGGLPWGARIRRFDRVSLARVQVVDSVREGWLIGAGAGVATTMAFVATCSGSRSSECRGWATLAGVSVGALEALIGQLIDGSINQTLFSTVPQRRVALRVWPRHKAAGLLLAIDF
jgi:hypothetical protein